MTKDTILATLPLLAELERSETPVTLMVGGLLICGGVISRSIFEEQRNGKLARHFEKINAAAAFLTESDSGPENTDQANFLHLKDAKYVVGGTALPTGDGVHIRVRIESVDGFSFGRVVL